MTEKDQEFELRKLQLEHEFQAMQNTADRALEPFWIEVTHNLRD